MPFPGRPAIDEALVRDLVREQFPQWAALPVSAIAEARNDHRVFHLGTLWSFVSPRLLPTFRRS